MRHGRPTPVDSTLGARLPQPPPMPSLTVPVPSQCGQGMPPFVPVPPQSRQRESPLPGVPGGASSPGFGVSEGFSRSSWPMNFLSSGGPGGATGPEITAGRECRVRHQQRSTAGGRSRGRNRLPADPARNRFRRDDRMPARPIGLMNPSVVRARVERRRRVGHDHDGGDGASSGDASTEITGPAGDGAATPMRGTRWARSGRPRSRARR
jgi:hypothetical protein